MCVWFLSPQPQPGRSPVEASTGAAAAGAVFTLADVLVTASFAAAVPFDDFSVATDDACSGSATVGVVAVTSAETEAVVGTDAGISRVAAPAIKRAWRKYSRIQSSGVAFAPLTGS